MFGDFEAQRHWMEITINLPIDEWFKRTYSINLRILYYILGIEIHLGII